MRMSYRLANSTIESEGIEEASRSKIYGTKFKKKQILFLLITLAYSILNNFIIKKPDYLVFTTALITMNLLSLIGIRVMSNTPLAKHYEGWFRFFHFINKFSKLLILLISVLSVLTTDKEILKLSMDIWEAVYCWNLKDVKDSFMALIIFGLPGIMLILNTILFMFYFVIVFLSFFKFFPPFGIVVYFIWLFSNNREFEYYKSSESKGFIVHEVRLMNEDVTPYGKMLIRKLLISLIWIVVIACVGYLFYRYYYLDFIGTIQKFLEIIKDEYGSIK